jgi:osmoprotectant transport system substrate-binding protein
MKSKKTALAALVAAAGLVLSACGSSSPLGTSSTSTTTTATSATTSTSGGSGSGSSSAEGSCDTSGAATSTGASSSGSASSSAASSSAAASSLPAAGPTATGPIKIGSAGFQESALVAEIYAGALTAKGIKVEKTLNIGEREAYYKGMQDGSINLIPEYTGNLLLFKDTNATATSAADVYAALPAVLAPDKLLVLDQSKAEDKDSLNVTKETAAKYNLKTIADLAKVACNLTFGGPQNFATRSYGIPGLEKNYGLKFKEVTALDVGGTLSVQGLLNGQVDVTDLFTTDPSIAKNGFVTLEDPKNNFAAQIITPLIAASVATDDVKSALNAVSAKLTTDNLITALIRVYSNESAEVVAKDWLTQNGLA